MSATQRSDTPNDWMLDALCAQVGGSAFFADDNYQAARTICAQCDVADQCLAYTMKVEPAHDRHGFFAGLTANQRTKLAQQKGGLE